MESLGPRADIAGCARAHVQLGELVATLSDADVGRPSLLAGWTVGHLLTHLARNAEAMCLRIEAATRGEMIEQYLGGASGRATAIEAGSARNAEEIRLDVLEWSSRLDERFRSIPEAMWDRPVRTVSGREHALSLLPFRRWREVEVHLVDLGIGLASSDWNQEFVDRTLPQLVADLAGRADQRELAAWLFGRGPAPELDPWG